MADYIRIKVENAHDLSVSSFLVNRYDSIAHIKRRFSNVTGWSEDAYHLMVRGRMPDDTETVASLGLEDGSCLRAFLKSCSALPSRGRPQAPSNAALRQLACACSPTPTGEDSAASSAAENETRESEVQKDCSKTISEDEEDVEEESIAISESYISFQVVNEQIRRKHETDIPRLKPSTPFRDFMRAFCQRRKKGIGYYVFKLNGNELKPSDTPSSVGMKHGDTIQTTLRDVCE